MLVTMLKSKLQDGVITESREDYEGSIMIDEKIMNSMRLVEYEAVYVNSLEYDARHLTYVIPGEAGSGILSVRGALAQYFKEGDRVHINCFCSMTVDETSSHRPRVVKSNVYFSEKG